MTRARVLWPLLSVAALFVPRGAPAQETACGPVSLRAPIAREQMTEVLVLASPHLRQLDRLDRSTLDTLLDQLERWGPDVIGIEVLPASDIAAMTENPAFAPVLEAFAASAVAAGSVARAALGATWHQASQEGDSLLSGLSGLPAAERAAARARLVALLAAAYRLPSAALQWSYLREEEPDAAAAVPDSLGALLQREVDAATEGSAIGLALARRLGLQEIHAIDDHFDKDVYLQVADELQAQLAETEAYREVVDSGAIQALTTRLSEAHATGDLLTLYQRTNDPAELAAGVDLEWYLFFRTRLPSGLDRARIAMWEERNYGIAANVRRMAAQIPGGRALVLIGASHKAFLDAYLACSMDLVPLGLQEVIGPSPP